jgi:hypothetical protein
MSFYVDILKKNFTQTKKVIFFGFNHLRLL